MESSKRLNIQEPGAERRQEIIDALNVMAAEKIDKKT
jgi:hypothetical protein